MAIRVGLYDFFAYTIPGIFYLLIAGFALSIFRLLPIGWDTLNDLSFISLVLLTGAGYVTGYLIDPFGFRYSKLFRPRVDAATSLLLFEEYHPWIKLKFTHNDWGILLRLLKQSSNEAAADIEQFNAVSIMLRNLGFGFLLLAAVFLAYFALVSQVIGNLALMTACLALSGIAVRVSKKFREWYYLGIYEAAAAQQFSAMRWMQYQREERQRDTAQ